MNSAKLGRNDPCWCGSGKKWKACHFPEKTIESPHSKAHMIAHQHSIPLYSAEEIVKIKTACQKTANILNEVCLHAKPGVTTKELDDLSIHLHKQHNMIPASLGYGSPPFPATLCTSINEVVCHGIPSSYVLQEGDILNVDISSQYNGFFGDCSKMIMIGGKDCCSSKAIDLIDSTEECLKRAITKCQPFEPLHVIGDTISSIAESRGFAVVRECVGHGIGRALHHPPQVKHYANNSPIIMLPGMVFTIEPMINEGSYHIELDRKDKWTIRTRDRKLSAQFEHTILITESGCEVLTKNANHSL